MKTVEGTLLMKWRNECLWIWWVQIWSQKKILQVRRIFYVILSSVKVLRTGDCD